MLVGIGSGASCFFCELSVRLQALSISLVHTQILYVIDVGSTPLSSSSSYHAIFSNDFIMTYSLLSYNSNHLMVFPPTTRGLCHLSSFLSDIPSLHCSFS